ncbi:vacuolar protein 8 isoform X2 [Esox lucius]|uniref:Vacuolar protein 8 n=1 Tax=Esox lucius TaxID=8010 RepID=A0A3P9AFY1_ESOLU|nr:vacuolar protein 8 isoform X2 [Esox lucius]
MDTGLCKKCAQLLKNLVASLNQLAAGFVKKMKECMTALSNCSCLRKNKSSATYSVQQERQAACALLDHLDTVESPLHVALLEPYRTLLLSSDLEVQRKTSLSLANLLFKNKVSAEQIIETGMVLPLLERLQSWDPTVQRNSGQCVALLASSDSSREAILSMGGVIPLLVLAKSYDPLVQQNAVWALLNLTLSEGTMKVLCREGAIPVLALLLQSSNYKVQFYSCSALSNIAMFPEHHPKMLGIGDSFLLKSLLTLMSSSVEKNATQACRCLRILSGNVGTLEQLMHLDCALPLKKLICSPSLPLAEAAIRLLSELSTHELSRTSLVNVGMLHVIEQLLLGDKSSPIIIEHIVVTIINLSSACEEQQAVMYRKCLTGLLQALVSSVTSEETVLCITSCLHHLISYDNVIKLLKPHYATILEYILLYLKNQEVRFQQLAIETLCNLKKDQDFSVVMSSSLEEQLKMVHAQTERTRLLLQKI